MRRLALAALLAAGCGGAPAPASDSGAGIDASTMRIVAPEGVDRWEPSGGAIRGDRLWIVNDRGGWLAAYALPLKPGQNAPIMAHAVKPNDGRVKFEALAPDGEGGLLLLETMKRSVWRCAAPDAGCPDLERVDTDDALDLLEDSVPKPVNYITYEALAHSGERLWVGSRGYETVDGTFHPWALIAEPSGRITYDGQPWVVDGKAYGLSDIAVQGDWMWMTWSHESTGSCAADVAGLIARAPLSADGVPGQPTLCHVVGGKPEGVVPDGDGLWVIFDQDGDRKDPSDPTKFPLAQTEDIVRRLPARCPDGRVKPMGPVPEPRAADDADDADDADAPDGGDDD